MAKLCEKDILHNNMHVKVESTCCRLFVPAFFPVPANFGTKNRKFYFKNNFNLYQLLVASIPVLMLTTNGRSFFFGNHQTFNLSNEVQGGQVSADQVSADQVSATQVSATQVSADQVSADQVSTDQVAADQVSTDQVSADQVFADEVTADLTTGQMDENDHSMHIGYDLSTLNQQRNPVRISKVLGKRFNPK